MYIYSRLRLARETALRKGVEEPNRLLAVRGSFYFFFLKPRYILHDAHVQEMGLNISRLQTTGWAESGPLRGAVDVRPYMSTGVDRSLLAGLI